MEDNTSLLGGEDLDRNNRPIGKQSLDFLKGAAKTIGAQNPSVQPVRREGEFLPEYDTSAIPGIKESVTRNQNQSGWEMFGNLLMQGVVGEGVGGTIEASGYLTGLITEALAPSENGELAFDNVLAGWGRAIKEGLSDAHPIYEAAPGTFNLGDPAFWASNGVSAFSTLSLAIPGFGVGKGISYAAKAIKFLKASKEIKIGAMVMPGEKLAEILGTAAASRHAESVMESAQVFDEVYRRLQNKVDPKTGMTYTDVEAKNIAADAASSTYNYNWLALATDIPQYASMLTGFSLFKGLAKTRAGKIGARISNVAGTGISEGAEELYQHSVQEESIRSAFLNAGLEVDTELPFHQRILVNSLSDEGKISAFVGGLSGAAQVTLFKEIVPNLFKKRLSKDSENEPEVQEANEKMAEAARKMDKFTSYDNIIERAVATGDNATYDFVQALQAIDVSFPNIKSGNLQLELDKIDEFVEQKSAETEGAELEDIQNRAEALKQDLRDLETTFNKTNRDFKFHNDSSVSNKGDLINELSIKNFLTKKLRTQKKNYEAELQDELKEFDVLDSEEQTKFVDASENLKALELYREVLEKELSDSNTTESKKKGLNDRLKKVKSDITKESKNVESLKEGNTFIQRGNVSKIKYNIKRTEDLIKEANNEINKFDNKNYVINRGKEIDSIRNKDKSQKQAAEQAANVPEETEKQRPAIPNIDWEDSEDRVNKLSKLNNRLYENKDENNAFPKNEGLVNRILANIDSRLGDNVQEARAKAISILGKMMPAVGEVKGEGIPAGPNGEILIRFNPENPNETMISIMRIFNEGLTDEFHDNNPEDAKAFKEIQEAIKDAINQEISDTQRVADSEDLKTKGATEKATENSQPKASDKDVKDKNSYNTPISQKTDLSAVTPEFAFQKDPSAQELFEKGTNYINSPSGLTKGEKIYMRLGSETENANIANWYQTQRANNVSVDANNAVIYIEAVVDGSATIIGMVPAWKEGKSDALKKIRTKIFANPTNIYSTEVTEVGDSLRVNGERQSSKSENIPYFQDSIILALFGTENGYIVNNESEIEGELESWNRTEVPDYVRHHKARPHIIATAPGGTARPEIIDTKRLGDIPGAVDKIFELINEFKDSTNWRETKEKINEITFIGKKAFDNNYDFAFNIKKNGIIMKSPSTGGVLEFTLDEITNYENTIKTFFSQKTANFNAKKSNIPGIYINELGTFDSYNDYVLETITDTDWTGQYSGTKFSFDEKIRKVSDKQKSGIGLDDESSVPDTKIVNEKSKKKNPTISKDSKGNDVILPKFKKPTDSSITAGTIDSAKGKTEVEWFKEKFPNIPLRVRDGLLEVYNKGGEEAWGLFKDAVVYISKQAGIGTVYHEAYHVVHNLFLTEEQKQAVELEAQQLWGGQGIGIEEDLADAYMHHVMGIDYKGVSMAKSSAIKRFFDSILVFFKKVLNKPLTIEQLFNEIDNKTFDNNSLKRDISNFRVEKFRRVNSSFKSKEQKRRVVMISRLVWANINGKLREGIISDIESANLNEVLQEVHSSISEMVGPEGVYTENGNQEMIDKINTILDPKTFKGLSEEVFKFFKSFDFITKGQNNISEADFLDEVNESITDQTDFHDVAHFEISGKDKSSPLVKRALHFLTTGAVDDIGFPETVNFHKTWNYVAEAVADAETLNEMVSNLKERVTARPELQQLINLLENTDEQFKSAFYSTFANQKMKLITIGSIDGKTVTYETNRKSLTKVIVDRWEGNWEASSYSKLKDGVHVPVKSLIQKEFELLKGTVSRYNNSTEKLKTKDYKAVQAFYRVLGIEITEDLLREVAPTGKLMAKWLRGTKNRGLLPMMQRVLESNANPYLSDKHHEKSGLIALAKRESKYNTDLYAASTTGGKGTKKHGITYQSYTSRLLDSLKNKKDMGLSAISKYSKYTIMNPNAENKSLFLRKFDRDQDRANKFKDEDFIKNFDWATLESFNIGGKVKEYDELNPKDKLLIELELFHSLGDEYGWFFQPTPGDKGNSIALKLSKMKDVEALEELSKQAYAEYSRIVEARMELEELPLNKQIINYHYKIEGGKRVPGNATKFIFFPELNNVFIKNDELVAFDSNIAKDKIGTALTKEIQLFHNRIHNEQGLGIVKAEYTKERQGFVNSELSERVVGKYRNPETGVIDTYSMARDFVMNSTVWNTEMIKLFHLDAAYYKDADTFNKRAYESQSAGKRAREGKYGVNRLVRSLILKEPKVDLGMFGSTDVADAQGWVSMNYYRKYKQGIGEWSEKNQEAYDRVAKGKGTAADNRLIMSPLKFFTYEIGEDGPIQIKHSVIPLIPALTKDSNLAKLAKIMEDNNIDEVNVESGFKVGARSVIDFENIDKVDIQDNVVEFPNSGRFLIQEISDKEDSPKYGSQIRKLIHGLVKDDVTYKVGSTKMTGKAIKDELHELVNKNLELSAKSVTKLLRNPKRLAKAIINQFRERGLPDNHEKALALDETGKFKYPLSLPGLMKKVEQVLNALYRNNVTVNRIFGAKAVQFSSWGFDEELKYVEDADGKRYAEIAVPARLFKGKTLEEVQEYFTKGVIYRIPTQSKASMLAVKVVSLIPEAMGDVARLPLEIVAQMGSDFDVDSVNIMLPVQDAVKGSKDERNNRIIELNRAILESSHHFDEITNPVGNKTLDNYRTELIGSEELNNRKSYTGESGKRISSPNTQADYFNNNMAGKSLIGRFARHVVHHAVSYNAKYQLSVPFYYGGKEITTIGQDPDKKVTNYLQELLNAAVDNTNDPIAADLNINLLTSEPLALLVRMEVPLNLALDLINHDVIKDLVREWHKKGNVSHAINNIASIRFKEEYKNLPDVIDLSSDLVNSTKSEDIAAVLKLFTNLVLESDNLSKDITSLSFDGSNGVGSTLYHKMSFVERMTSEVEGRGVNNVISQAKGFPQLLGFFNYGVVEPLREIGSILPLIRTTFNQIHGLLNLNKYKTVAMEVASYAYMNYIFSKAGSPIQRVYSKENVARLFKGDNSLWNRIMEYKAKNPSHDHAILDHLLHKNKNGLHYIEFNNNAHWSADEISDISDSWLDMLEDEATKEIAIDLIEYSLNANGFSYSPHSLSQLVPVEYYTTTEFSKTEAPLVDYWRQEEGALNNSSTNLGDFIHKFIENHYNFKNYQFVKDYSSLISKYAKTQAINPSLDVIRVKKDVNGSYYPTSVRLLAKDVDKKTLDSGMGYIKATFPSGKEKKTALLKYRGEQGSFVIFDIVDTKGDGYNLQEWHSESSVIDSSNLSEGVEAEHLFAADSTRDLVESRYNALDDNGLSFISQIDEIESVETRLQEREDAATPEELESLVSHFTEDKQYQISSIESKEANEKLDSALKSFLSHFGIRVESVDSIKTRLGDDAIAVSEITKKLIKISKGEARLDTLPEEAGHFFVEILGDNNPLVIKMKSEIQNTMVYQETLKDYYDLYEGNEIKLIKEAVGKAIAQALVGEFRRRESNNDLANKIYKTIQLIIKRIKSIFGKMNENNYIKEVDSFAIAAKMILDSNLTMPSDKGMWRHPNEILDTALTQAQAGNIDSSEDYYYQLGRKSKKAKEDSTQRPLNSIVTDPMVSEARKVNAVLDKALSQLKKREQFLLTRGAGAKDKAAEISKQVANLELLIKQKLGVKAIAKFVENAAASINGAHNTAKQIQEKGESYVEEMEIGRSVTSELNRVYNIAKSFNFIDSVLNLALQSEPNSQLNKLVGLLQELKSNKDNIIFITQNTGQGLIAKWLHSVGSKFMSESEIRSELEIGKKDIGMFSRWFRAMNQVSDPILQLIAKAVAKEKQSARIDSMAYTKKLTDALSNHKKGGKPASKFADFIETFKGQPTGYFISQYTSEYYNLRDQARALVDEAIKLEKKGEVERARKSRQEANQIYSKINQTGTDANNELVLTSKPKDSYLNKDYDRVSKDPMYQTLMEGMRTGTELLLPGKRRLYDKEYDRFRIPSVRKSFAERVTDQGLDAISLDEAFKAHSTDTDFGILDENNKPIGQIPVFYTGRLDVKDLSLDLPVNVQMYYNMSQNFLNMHRIQDRLELSQTVMNHRQVQVIRGNKVLKNVLGDKEEIATKEGGEVAKMLKDFIDANVYGQKKIASGNVGKYDAQKLTGGFLKYNAILSLGSNILSAVANPTVGEVMQSIEAFAGEFFKPKAYLQSGAIYTSSFAGIIEDVTTGKKHSKVGALNELFDAIQEYASFESGVKEVKNKYGNVFSGSSLMFMQQAGEHWIQSRLMISMLLSKTWDAKTNTIRDIEKDETSLWHQFRVDNGVITLNGKALNAHPGLKNQIIDTHLQIRAISQRLHGNYTDLERSAAHRTIAGQMAFQFRNWMVAGVDRRWGTRRNDERLGTVVEGNYITVGKFMYQLFQDMKDSEINLTASWNDLSSTEKANMRRTLLEVVTVLGLITLLSFAFSEGGDEEDWLYNFTAYQVNRLYTELMFYVDWRETTKLAKSPAAAISTFEKVGSLFEMIFHPFEEYESGSRTGEKKIWKAASDLTPIWRDVDRTKHVRDLLQFFND